MTPFNMVEQSSCPSFSKSGLNYFNNITTLIPAEKACVCILITQVALQSVCIKSYQNCELMAQDEGTKSYRLEFFILSVVLIFEHLIITGINFTHLFKHIDSIQRSFSIILKMFSPIWLGIVVTWNELGMESI